MLMQTHLNLVLNNLLFSLIHHRGSLQLFENLLCEPVETILARYF